MIEDLIGKTHTFEDGDSITVVQVKYRGPDQGLVTYQIQQGPGIPRKLVMTVQEFIDTYGHLFNSTDNN